MALSLHFFCFAINPRDCELILFCFVLYIAYLCLSTFLALLYFTCISSFLGALKVFLSAYRSFRIDLLSVGIDKAVIFGF